LSYATNYPEDEVDCLEPTPPLSRAHLGSGPCRNFRDPQTAADEERARHFAQQRLQQLPKLVSAPNALRDVRTLPPAAGAEAEYNPLEALYKLGSTSHMVSGTHILAGETGSVYVPSAWRSQSKASAAQDDLFSDVAENGGDTDGDDGDDEEQWDVECARAEEDGGMDGEVREGRRALSHENGRLSTWRATKATATSQGAGKDAVPISASRAVAAAAPYVKHKQGVVNTRHESEDETRVPDRNGGSIDESVGKNASEPKEATHVFRLASGAIAADPAAAPYVKHTSLTATRDWAYPAPSAPSPTESQLLTLGFEFHNELSEKEEIARFGDKAFRKTLREVLPSLSRKQQWYAWRRANEENYGEGTSSNEALKEEVEEEREDYECRCPGSGEERDKGDGSRGKLLSDCLCGDWGGCDERYLWHHPDDACETERELREPSDAIPVHRSDPDKGRPKGDGPTEWLGQDCKCSKMRDHVNGGADGERDTFTSDSGGGGDGANCPCLPGRYASKGCWTSRAQHHRPVLNPETSDRPSDWTGLYSHGRLVDGKPIDQVRQGLDVGHDVPAASVSRIPGLGLLDPSSDVQPSYGQVRRSIEPEMPRHQMHRESTPAYEDRSPSPSPIDRREDIEMTEAPSATTLPPLGSRLSLPRPTSSPNSTQSPMHAVTATETPTQPRCWSRSRSRSPVKETIPALQASKTPKRGGRRKSAVQGSKVEKTSTTKGRAVPRTVTAAAKNAAENAGNMVKEAVARIEASVKAQGEDTPRRSARIIAKRQHGVTLKE
jgi:hypothetical protein